jgi:hypothetical protein
MEIEPPNLSKKDEEMANQCGGCDEEDYETPDTVPYYDKPDHFERSCVNQPNHLVHKKEIYGT